MDTTKGEPLVPHPSAQTTRLETTTKRLEDAISIPRGVDVGQIYFRTFLGTTMPLVRQSDWEAGLQELFVPTFTNMWSQKAAINRTVTLLLRVARGHAIGQDVLLRIHSVLVGFWVLQELLVGSSPPPGKQKVKAPPKARG